MDRFAQMIVAASRQAESDSGIDIAKEPDRIGASIATGHRRPRRVPGLLPDADRPRSRPGQPVLDHGDHPEHGRRLGLDGARHERPALLPVHRVRGFEHGDRRRRGRDPARTRRRDDLRRHRGRDHARRYRRLRRDARALAPQRQPERRVPPVRRRPRRLRDGRGRGRGRARGAGACEGARREDLRRADRLRRLVGREPRHRAGPGRDEPGPRDADGLRRRGHRPVGDRLHQRARHLDAARRHVRDARDQARRRARRTPTRSRSPRRRAPPATVSARRGRSRRSSPSWRRSAASCRRRSTTRSRIRRATSTTSRTRRARSTSASASRTRSASAGTTPASCSASSTSSAPDGRALRAPSQTDRPALQWRRSASNSLLLAEP